jgi:hypothetical protein
MKPFFKWNIRNINNFDVSKEIDGAANLAEEVTVSKNNQILIWMFTSICDVL